MPKARKINGMEDIEGREVYRDINQILRAKPGLTQREIRKLLIGSKDLSTRLLIEDTPELGQIKKMPKEKLSPNNLYEYLKTMREIGALHRKRPKERHRWKYYVSHRYLRHDFARMQLGCLRSEQLPYVLNTRVGCYGIPEQFLPTDKILERMVFPPNVTLRERMGVALKQFQEAGENLIGSLLHEMRNFANSLAYAIFCSDLPMDFKVMLYIALTQSSYPSDYTQMHRSVTPEKAVTSGKTVEDSFVPIQESNRELFEEYERQHPELAKMHSIFESCCELKTVGKGVSSRQFGILLEFCENHGLKKEVLTSIVDFIAGMRRGFTPMVVFTGFPQYFARSGFSYLPELQDWIHHVGGVVSKHVKCLVDQYDNLEYRLLLEELISYCEFERALESEDSDNARRSDADLRKYRRFKATLDRLMDSDLEGDDYEKLVKQSRGIKKWLRWHIVDGPLGWQSREAKEYLRDLPLFFIAKEMNLDQQTYCKLRKKTLRDDFFSPPRRS